MFDKDTWQEIWGTMKKNKLRTGLTALGVFWGIFMLVFLLGMGSGLENGVYKDFGARAKNVMYVNAGRTSLPYDGYPAGRRILLTMDDLDAIKTQVPKIDKIAPRLEIGPYVVNYKGLTDNYEIRGELTEMMEIEAFILHDGRYINQVDVDENRKVAVIGTKVRDVLFGKEKNAIGEHIMIRGIDFKVIGVYGPEQIKEWTKSDMESVVIPLSTMHNTFGTGNIIHWMVCSALPATPVSEIEPVVNAILKERHHIAPADPRGIFGFNLEKEYQQVQGLFLGIKAFLWFVGIGTLLAGIVGVSNIMLIIVKERTKEIGIRKALGATPRSIINMILTESIFITSISGYMGLLFGTLVIGGINFLMVSNNIEPRNFYNPQVNALIGIAAIIVLIISGTLAGLIPAIQASKVNPVVALKDE